MSRRGFTLVELLVATVFVAIGLVGVLRGIRSLTQADVKAQQAGLLQRLAMQKMDELGSVTDVNSADNQGDFSEQGYANILWTLQVSTTSVTNLDSVTVTVTQDREAQSLTGLLYVRPTTGSTTGGRTTP